MRQGAGKTRHASGRLRQGAGKTRHASGRLRQGAGKTRQTSSKPRAVVLLSGGLDSATAAAVARSEGFELYALTADYGQRHSREIEGALLVGQSLGVREHRVVRLPVGDWGGSSLTDSATAVPLKGAGARVQPGIPTTYVPARNLVLLAVASSYAEAVGADSVFIGATQVDFSGYPDCRGDFLASFEATLALGTKRGREGRPIRVRAPLLDITKDAIIALGSKLGVDYSLTWSCYSGGDRPCGGCDSCRIRAEGFRKAGVPDPSLRRASGPGRASPGGRRRRSGGAEA